MKRAICVATLLSVVCSCGEDAPPEQDASTAPEAAPADAAPSETKGAEPPPPAPPEERVAFGMAKVAEAVIRAEPQAKGRPIGVLRWGAHFEASDTRGSGESRWVRVKDVGWIKGDDVLLRRKAPPKMKFVPVEPELDEAMPYRYARVTAEKVPVYKRPPRRGTDPSRFVLRHLKQGYFFTVDQWVNIYDRQLHRTTRYWFIPREGTTMVTGPTFEGIEVTEETELPFLWVTDPTALLCPEPVAPAPDGGIEPCQRAERHKRYPYFGRRESAGVWYKTSGKQFVPALHVAFVDRLKSRPGGLGANERWIHVDLRNQTAALYEGDRMAFVTLISSGDEGHTTPTGTFRVESKHVTATMDNENNLSGPYFIQDVPWVLYFRGSYGLHGAFWHDRFGLKTSHGCVNLSPADARRFFLWATAPVLPQGWHGVHTPPRAKGTLIHITD